MRKSGNHVAPQITPSLTLGIRMPPKRKRTPDTGGHAVFTSSESEAKWKKLSKRSTFPRFEDGDVVISLGSAEGDLVLYKRDLSRMCEYFEEFDEIGWPESFTLQIVANVSECQVVPVEEALPEQHNHTEVEDHGDRQLSTVGPLNEDGVAGHARRLNEIIFRLLYREPVDLSVSESKHSPAHVVRDVAKLAASYGCVQHVQGELVSAIVTAGGIGGDLIRRNPCLLLETACLLKNETIFVDALRHAAGRRAALTDEMRSVPAEIARLVEHHAGLLKARVKEVCRLLASPAGTTLDLPTFIAWGIFYRYLVANIFPKDPESPEMFKSLAYLNSMRTGMELVDTQQLGDIMESVRVVDCGLVQASNITYLIRDDDREEHRRELDDLDEALEEALNVKSIKAELRQIVEKSKLRLAPLFSGDKNTEHFTLTKFDGRLPWQRDPCEHT
ncbi:hypothetical protein B0A49_11943 [Cryomyces minteri]|uniref:Uncharacterized protein n=1 Tax=Cryomyces minteri TaxID=331657 RepID=A0A4U0W8J8_9PEZI|nr:hypothetical protein B0A49_11943 [Cryomyces minteri]